MKAQQWCTPVGIFKMVGPDHTWSTNILSRANIDATSHRARISWARAKRPTTISKDATTQIMLQKSRRYIDHDAIGAITASTLRMGPDMGLRAGSINIKDARSIFFIHAGETVDKKINNTQTSPYKSASCPRERRQFNKKGFLIEITVTGAPRRARAPPRHVRQSMPPTTSPDLASSTTS
ncbi:hypothetical protein EVAR_43697_1 [Eumeta japonica]|uniref:Uncharacterized protein n=1 Tax=Eumeta variegata TaxID=151549 RepID=A0A4C1X0S4_EUMVA|nr:hypothetical protein EVAR_43697_1 [Eumeta japonica]